MPSEITILKVFIASPSDVPDERQILEEVVSEINNTWGDRHQFRLDLIKWETHSKPGFGADAQDVINTNIPDDYDLFLGVMWGRFGSPTKRADSGTEEEFNRAFSRLKSSPDSLQIMFYFKNADIPINSIDIEQFGKVQAFKKRISDECGGLYNEFESTDDFQTKVRMHLSMFVQDWLEPSGKNEGIGTNESRVASATKLNESKPHNPLANFLAIENDVDEDGLFDLAERMSDAMVEVTSIVEKMTNATNELAENITKRTKEVEELTADGKSPSIKSAKRVSSKVATNLNVFVKRISVEIPEFYNQNSIAMDSFGKMALIADSDFSFGLEEKKALFIQIQGYGESINGAVEGMASYRETIANLPKMTSEFNRARKRTIAIMDDLLTQLEIASNQSADVKNLIQRLIENSGLKNKAERQHFHLSARVFSV